MYPNETIRLAFKNFKAENKTFNDSEVSQLDEALMKLDKYQPSNHLVSQWNKNYGHVENVPSQLARDMLIVDYLVQRKDMSLNRATSVVQMGRL